jgi:hypothetical protein
MPVIVGMVGGRVHGVQRDATETHVSPTARKTLPFDFWEAELVERWLAEGVGVEEVARRLMRPVSQIVGFDPVRPNGRRL